MCSLAVIVVAHSVSSNEASLIFCLPTYLHTHKHTHTVCSLAVIVVAYFVSSKLFDFAW